MFEVPPGDALATALLLLAAARYRRLAVWVDLCKIRLRPSAWHPPPPEEMPAHVRALLDSAGTGLAALGFRPLRREAAPPATTCDPRPLEYSALHWHPERAVLARAELAEPVSGQATKVQFLSLWADGRGLLTVNRERWARFPPPPELRIVDGYRDDPAGQWRAHLEALAREGERGAPVADPEAVVRHGEDCWGFQAELVRLAATGWLREAAPGLWRFTARGAWRYAGSLARPPAPVRKALARPFRHDPAPDPTSTRLAEMEAVAAVIGLAAEPVPAWLKALLFTLTLAISVLLFDGGFGRLEALAVLTALLLHEFGHLAAMWACGYRNLAVFFLPFLGAAATGHKPHAPPWQEAIVLLAGPVPGLLLALAALQLPAAALPPPLLAWLRTWVWAALALNLVNLLPFGILDGGQLFELAVLGRWPRARAGLVAVGAVLGLAGAIGLGAPILAIAMAWLLASVPARWRAARTIAAIRDGLPDRGRRALSGREAITALGLALAAGRHGGDGAEGWTRRLEIARLAYPRLRQGIPGWGLSAGVLAAQGLALALPLALLPGSWGSASPPLLRAATISPPAPASAIAAGTVPAADPVQAGKAPREPLALPAQQSSTSPPVSR